MNVNETVAGLTISAKTEGVDQAKKQVEGLTKSTEQLGVVSETSSKGARSLEENWKRATLRLDEGARSQAAFARETKLAADAVRNGIATQQEANAHLARVAERYGQASTASKAFAAATSGVSGQLIALSAGAGPVGVFLSALGPWGVAAAVGLGAVSSVFDTLSKGAERIGDKAIELKKFSDVTGLSVTEIKGLTKAGLELGVSSDDIRTSVERFSVGLNAARKGSGELFEQVNKINPALAHQLALAPNVAKAWDILAEAIKEATDATQRNALARAAYGRGGLETAQVAMATVDKGGIQAMGDQIAKNTGLTKEWVAEIARLRAENIALQKSFDTTTDSLFALSFLQFQNNVAKLRKELLDEITRIGRGVGDVMSQPSTNTFDERFPVSQRGPSEGAMQAQQEAAAQREITAELEKQKKASEDRVSVDKMLLTIAEDSAAAEKRKAEVFAQNAAAYSNVSATTAQTLAALKDQLGVAEAVGVTEQIAAQHKATVNQLLREGKSLTDAIAIADAQREIAEAKIEALHQRQMILLQGQLNVAQQITGIGKINAQYEANIVSLMLQGFNLAQATAQAEMQRSIALAQVNAQAEQQLKNLQNEGELIRASSEWERGRIQARQEYNKLIEQGVDSEKAGAVAAQMQANARDRQLREEEKDSDRAADKKKQDGEAADRRINEQYEKDKIASSEAFAAAEARHTAYLWAAEAAEREAVAMRDAADAAIDLERAIKGFVPFALSAAFGVGSGGGSIGGQTWTDSSGRLTQFNPQGYTSSYEPIPLSLYDSIYGRGGYDPVTKAPNAQGREFQFNKAVASGGLASAVGGMLSQGVLTEGGLGAPPRLDTDRLGILQRAIELLPQEQQIGATRQLVGQLESAPPSLATSELIKQLNDKLDQLTQATDANTSATSAMTDVLSPFYSSDPRRTHLGFRAFREGGIMTQYGELPLRHYQGGGMATSPQVAVFGEGSTPEAYVPVPSGRIPVEIKQPANSNQRPVNVNIIVHGNADANTVGALKATAFQQAQAMRRVMR